MKIVGVLGGVASGKSLAASLLADRGATILAVDRLGHEVLTEAEVRMALRQRWGDTILAADGSVDRRQVARRVFASPPDGPRELAFLEQVTHPRIGARIESQLQTWVGEGRIKVVVLDAAVLVKAGWDRWCDQILFVDAPVELRRSRALARGWSEREFAAREAAQEPCEVKRRRATWVVDNSGSIDELATQIDRFWREVLQPIPPRVAPQPPRETKPYPR